MRTVFVLNENTTTEIMDPLNNIERLRKMRKLNSRRLTSSRRLGFNASFLLTSNRIAVEYK
ncbi:MAG: hypothetical protein PHQ52_00585 [Candidatus Omnitrophica bacterium]|nr:hypothetical protein [Candidatus Omnitrophota bacterium]